MTDTITLKDDRTLAYAECGNPRGKPVFFIHGTPGSRFFHPSDDVTTRLGVRLITVDRAGYGVSTFQPNRRLLDFPNDITQLANALGFGKFAIVGHSGGGPHTLACAYALPDRVTAAATIAGAGPIETPGATDDMVPINKLGFKYGQYLPWFIFRTLNAILFHERCNNPAKAFDNDKRRPPADQAIMDRPEIREMCIRTEVEAFRPGIKGMAWDARLITSPWGFHLEEIKVPVQIWHGTADNVTSVHMAEYMAGKIPNCRLIVCPDEGHMLLIPHWEEILTTLLA